VITLKWSSVTSSVKPVSDLSYRTVHFVFQAPSALSTLWQPMGCIERPPPYTLCAVQEKKSLWLY
jgi:hypothetical protein